VGLVLPFAHGQDSDQPLERDLWEVLGAIALVESGLARRVTLCGLRRPEACVVGASDAAREANVRLILDGAAGQLAVLVIPTMMVIDGPSSAEP
jgi:hypothetical protein